MKKEQNNSNFLGARGFSSRKSVERRVDLTIQQVAPARLCEGKADCELRVQVGWTTPERNSFNASKQADEHFAAGDSAEEKATGLLRFLRGTAAECETGLDSFALCTFVQSAQYLRYPA